MHKTWHFVKILIASVLMYTGLLRLIARRKLRDKAVVLTYHRVLDKDRRALSHSTGGIIVSEKTFEKNLSVLQRYFQIISMQRLIDYACGTAAFPTNSCLITFDDAWLDNYEVAFPLLRKHQVPVSIFVPVEYIDSNKMFWQEELMMQFTQILKSGDDEDIQFLKQLTSIQNGLDSRGFRQYIARLKNGKYSQVEKVLGVTRKRLKEHMRKEHYNKYMTWAQLREMKMNNVSFGSHSMSHRRLNKISEDECERELTSSKRELEDRLDSPVSALAYPNGDHDEMVEKQAASAGYQLAFTTDRGLINRQTDLLAIPRVNIHETRASNDALFLCTVLGIF